MDPTNPFAGGLPAPNPSDVESTVSPQAQQQPQFNQGRQASMDVTNPFFNQQNQQQSQMNLSYQNNQNGQSPQNTNPFFNQQQQQNIQYAQQMQYQQAMQYQQQQQYAQQQYRYAQAMAAQQQQRQLQRAASQQQLDPSNPFFASQRQNSYHPMSNSMNLDATNPFSNGNGQQHGNGQQQPQRANSVMTMSPNSKALHDKHLAAFESSLNQQPPKKETNEKKEKEKEEAMDPAQAKEEKRKRNRVRAVNELIATERTYVTKLEMLNNLYINPMKNNDKLLKSRFHSIIFPVVLQTILALNKKLLKSMEENPSDQIGKTIIDFVPYLKMYQNYMNNHEAASREIKKLRGDKNSEFVKYLTQKEMEQNGFTLESYLILPIQRMPRYELCLKEIIKLTKDDHPDKENLKKCFEKVAAVNKQINVNIKDYETRGKVYEIELRIMNLEVNKEKNKNKDAKKGSSLFKRRRNSKTEDSGMIRTRLVTPSRIFIKQGYLTKVSRKKDIKYLFFLFNDLLIYCSETVNDKLILHQKIDITDEFFRIESAVVLDDDIDYINTDQKEKKGGNKDKSRGNTFEIHSIQKSFLCYAEDNKEREEWIEAIEKCLDSIKKSGIDNKRKSNNSLQVQMGPQRFNSAPSLLGSGKNDPLDRFNSFNFAATKPEEKEDYGRVLETAPMWIPNDWTDECMIPNCSNKFSALLLKKRNHCRYCGKLVCTECSTKTLPHYEPKKRADGIHVKVCDICHDKYKVKPLMNVEQLSYAQKRLGANNNDSIDGKPSANINSNDDQKAAPMDPQIKQIEDDDGSSDSEDYWNGMYAQNNGPSTNPMMTPGGGNWINGSNDNQIRIPQSFTPVSAPQPAGDGDLLGILGNGQNNISSQMYQNNYNNNNNGNGIYNANAASYSLNNNNMSPLFGTSSINNGRNASIMSNNSSVNKANSRNQSIMSNNSRNASIINISPRHNYGDTYNNNNNPLLTNTNSNGLPSFPDTYSNHSNNNKNAISNPLPDPLPDLVHKKDDSLYNQDMGAVSAIIAANDNVINSMDLRSYGIESPNSKNMLPVNNNIKNKKSNSPKKKQNQYPNAVVLDENAEAEDSEDEFAANFANITIPNSHKSPVPRQSTQEFYGFMDSPKVNRPPANNGNNADNPDIYLDKNHENVKQLSMFGFTPKNIDDAWALMKQNNEHKSIVPDHGPLFVETMLNYLDKVQKQKSKSVIMNQYNNPQNQTNIFTEISHNNNNNNNNKNRNDPFNFDFGNSFNM